MEDAEQEGGLEGGRSARLLRLRSSDLESSSWGGWTHVRAAEPQMCICSDILIPDFLICNQLELT